MRRWCRRAACPGRECGRRSARGPARRTPAHLRFGGSRAVAGSRRAAPPCPPGSPPPRRPPGPGRPARSRHPTTRRSPGVAAYRDHRDPRARWVRRSSTRRVQARARSREGRTPVGLAYRPRAKMGKGAKSRWLRPASGATASPGRARSAIPRRGVTWLTTAGTGPPHLREPSSRRVTWQPRQVSGGRRQAPRSPPS